MTVDFGSAVPLYGEWSFLGALSRAGKLMEGLGHSPGPFLEGQAPVPLVQREFCSQEIRCYVGRSQSVLKKIK